MKYCRSCIIPIAAVLAAFFVVGCDRDPNTIKLRYLESGDRYFAKGKYPRRRLSSI
jgi:hypothetical protein